MIYFTSDTHFHHDNILVYCNRPYSSVDEMNTGIIDIWNSIVKPNDIVYHLGDFSFKGYWKGIAEVLVNLNGRINVVPGNHDGKALRKAAEEVRNTTILPRFHSIKDNGDRFELCHYPFESWPNRIIHLHGHSHGNSEKKESRLDVGWDVHHKPISIEEVRQLI